MCAEFLMMSPGCMFSVAMIQRFRLPPATSAMSADLPRGTEGQSRVCHAAGTPPTHQPPAPGDCPVPGARLHGSYRTLTTFSLPSW